MCLSILTRNDRYPYVLLVHRSHNNYKRCWLDDKSPIIIVPPMWLFFHYSTSIVWINDSPSDHNKMIHSLIGIVISFTKIKTRLHTYYILYYVEASQIDDYNLHYMFSNITSMDGIGFVIWCWWKWLYKQDPISILFLKDCFGMFSSFNSFTLFSRVNVLVTNGMKLLLFYIDVNLRYVKIVHVFKQT